MKKEINKQKIIVAMSGGVDSSVASALLKKQGYDVAGVFMRFWPENKNAPNLCCSEGAQKAAQLVAAKLKIPFYVINFEKEFKKEVVDNFLVEQARGRTPNPCVVCNKKIKFGLMFKKAKSFGANYFATGHYARIKKDRRGLFHIFRAQDQTKDQTYFLYRLDQKKLPRIIFPLGDLTKTEVIKMAKKWQLPYRKEESFDLCFVANDVESFLKKYLKSKAGKIMNMSGEILGGHRGLAFYTIGQRKRLPITQGPWWVIKKDWQKNILYVSDDEKDLYSDTLLANKLNWLDGEAPKLPMKVWAKIRYKSEPADATLRFAQGKNQLELIFKKPQRAITPGQSVVFYSSQGEVLGGGEIV